MKKIHHKREIILNKYKENLVGILHETGSKEVVIVCHGYRSYKDKIPMVNRNLDVAFANKGISAFRFDFAGNGDSGGSFQYGNNYREVDDFQSVIQCFEQEKRFVTAIIGYSKGGNVVLFYALRFKDVNNVVNISGRFDIGRGIEGRLGKDYLKRMKQYGFIDVANRKGATYQLIPQNPQSRTYEISTPSSGSKDLVLLTYNIMPFDLPSLSSLLLYLVLFSLERVKDVKVKLEDLLSKLGTFHSAVVFLGALNQNAVHPLVALENTVFYRERAAGMYLLLPYALTQVMDVTPPKWATAVYDVPGVLLHNITAEDTRERPLNVSFENSFFDPNSSSGTMMMVFSSDDDDDDDMLTPIVENIIINFCTQGQVHGRPEIATRLEYSPSYASCFGGNKQFSAQNPLMQQVVWVEHTQLVLTQQHPLMSTSSKDTVDEMDQQQSLSDDEATNSAQNVSVSKNAANEEDLKVAYASDMWFGTDTLFFDFYYQQYLAAKELKKPSWSDEM
uniref:Alpha/beta hydrolases superfamily protein n=1 Tax=Tanacetum cinerariifolium TaxID=118510 RepID=A0A6L2KRD0_TANCI|nr:alpha/beta hydrolases superfamily protein [Tanacetum cinerariifolium]